MTLKNTNVVMIGCDVNYRWLLAQITSVVQKAFITTWFKARGTLCVGDRLKLTFNEQ